MFFVISNPEYLSRYATCCNPFYSLSPQVCDVIYERASGLSRQTTIEEIC